MRTKLPVKFAVFEKMPVIGVESKGGLESNCEFGGKMGQIGNAIVHYGRFNCTIQTDDSGQDYGSVNPETGWYGGVNGLVERNITDLTIAPQMMPMETDRFYYSPVLGQYRITMLSAREGYNLTHVTLLDIGHSVYLFGQEIWLLILAFLIVFALILAIGKKFCEYDELNDNSVWSVATFALFHDSLEAETIFLKVWATCLAMLVFWADQYFEGSMSTNLVAREAPHVIDSWQQLLRQPNTSLKFLHSTRAFKHFKFAPSGSEWSQIWDYSLTGFNGQADKQSEHNMIDVKDAAVIIDRFRSKSAVICDVETLLAMLRTLTCQALNEQMESMSDKTAIPFLMWMARESGIPYLLSFSYSQGIRSDVRERMDEILRSVSESGLVYVWLKALSTPFGPLPNNRFTRECMTDEIVMPEEELQSLRVSSMKQVFRAFAGALAVAAAVHVLSILWFKCRKFWGKRQQRVRIAPVRPQRPVVSIEVLEEEILQSVQRRTSV